MRRPAGRAFITRAALGPRVGLKVLRVDSWSGRPGGGQEYVRSVADEMAARGHEQRLLQITDWRPSIGRPDEIVILRPQGRLRQLGQDVVDDPALRAAFREELSSFRPDLVHLHHFDASFGPLARLLAATQVPLVVTAHDAELVCPISTLVRPGNVVCDGGVRTRCLFTGCHVGAGGPYNLWQTFRFDREVAPRVRAFLAPSTRLREYLHANGYRPAVHLPPFARIPEALRRAAPPPPPDGAPRRVGFIGRLERYKGVHDLLEAFATLAPKYPSLRLDVAGDGPEQAAMAARARARGIADRVDFRGHLEREEKESWYRSVELVVVPSNTWENFGLVALEALTRTRPVVATDFGGLPDVVQDGASGRLVPLGDATALAAAIASLLDDPAGARRLGEEGRRRSLARFTPERHVDRLLAVYGAVLAGRDLATVERASDLLPSDPATGAPPGGPGGPGRGRAG